MIELAFVACTALACERFSLLFADITLMQCQIGAQVPLAEWSAEHEGYLIKEYTCKVLRADGELL